MANSKKRCLFVGEYENSENLNSSWFFSSVVSPLIEKEFSEVTLNFHSISKVPGTLETIPRNVIRGADFVIATIKNKSIIGELLTVTEIIYDVAVIFCEEISNTQSGISSKARFYLGYTRLDDAPAREKLAGFIREIISGKGESLESPREAITSPRSSARSRPRVLGPSSRPVPAVIVGEIADRIDAISASISALRLNMDDDYVSQLQKISFDLRDISNEITQKDIDDTIEKFINLLVKYLDAVGNSKTARVVVAAAVAGVLGHTGVAAAEIYTVTIAAWNGKETLMEALKHVGSKRKGTKSSKTA